jgi:hypothetical protein
MKPATASVPGAGPVVSGKAGARPHHHAWPLQERMLPPIYEQALLHGREWARPGLAA